MSGRFKCPHCEAIFIKTPAIEACEILHDQGIGVASADPKCPACQRHIQLDKLTTGEYDVPESPSRDNLEEMVEKLISNFMLEAVEKGVNEDEVVRDAINKVGEILFQQYGLKQDEILDVVVSALRRQQ